MKEKSDMSKQTDTFCGESCRSQHLPIQAGGQRRINNRFGIVVFAALSAVVASWAYAAMPRSARQSTNWPNPVQTDVDVSGPFLQPHTANPHDAHAIDRCGEPEITQDTVHPDTLIIDCMSQGDLNYQSPAPASYMTWSYKDPTKTVPWNQPCHVFISRDGGRTWQQILPSPIMSRVVTNCEDPLAASGPHGQLYLGGDADHFPADGKISPMFHHPEFAQGAIPLQEFGIAFTRSLDGGKTWSRPIVIPTAVDRPFWTVDQSTGAIYDVSGCIEWHRKSKIGTWGCTPTSRNLAVSADGGRTWTPSLSPFNVLTPTDVLTPGRLHNINTGASFHFISAARGIFAAAGVRGGSEMGPGRALVFKYSTNEGHTFNQRPIELTPSTCAPVNVQGIAADPARRGTFAVLVTCGKIPRALHVDVTSDLGRTWSQVATLAVNPPPDYRGRPSAFNVNRSWIAYSPTGVLGVFWREIYGTTKRGWFGFSLKDGPQDVFLALARDGRTFGRPIRLNTAASPAPDPRIPFGDDISNLILGRHYAYAVWGDWRSGELQTWFRKVPLPRS